MRGLQEQCPDSLVLLFGSRAQGRWLSNSDIDIAVIGFAERDDEDAYWDLRGRADDLADQSYGVPPGVQVEMFSWGEFESLRTSLPHMAGQIQHHGVTAEGEHLAPVKQDNPWPGIQELLQAARWNLQHSLTNRADNRNPALAVKYASDALETSYKAALSTAGVGWDRKHHLHEFARSLVVARPAWWQPNLTAEVLKIMGKFRVNVPYKDPSRLNWPPLPVDVLIKEVQASAGRLAGMVLKEIGKTPDQAGYPDTWPSDKEKPDGWRSMPLHGWEEADLNLMSTREADKAEGLAEGLDIGLDKGMDIGRTEANIRTMNVLLKSVLGPVERDLVAMYWRENGSPMNATERIVRVQEGEAWVGILVPDTFLDNMREADTNPDQSGQNNEAILELPNERKRTSWGEL